MSKRELIPRSSFSEEYFVTKLMNELVIDASDVDVVFTIVPHFDWRNGQSKQIILKQEAGALTAEIYRSESLEMILQACKILEITPSESDREEFLRIIREKVKSSSIYPLGDLWRYWYFFIVGFYFFERGDLILPWDALIERFINETIARNREEFNRLSKERLESRLLGLRQWGMLNLYLTAIDFYLNVSGNKKSRFIRSNLYKQIISSPFQAKFTQILVQMWNAFDGDEKKALTRIIYGYRKARIEGKACNGSKAVLDRFRQDILKASGGF